MPRSLAI